MNKSINQNSITFSKNNTNNNNKAKERIAKDSITLKKICHNQVNHLNQTQHNELISSQY